MYHWALKKSFLPFSQGKKAGAANAIDYQLFFSIDLVFNIYVCRSLRFITLYIKLTDEYVLNFFSYLETS